MTKRKSRKSNKTVRVKCRICHVTFKTKHPLLDMKDHYDRYHESVLDQIEKWSKR